MICPFGRVWAVLLGIGLICKGFALDRVRTETQVNEALERYGVTGKGVLVAVLDRGIDWRNADFRDAAGKTRLEYIYDLMDSTGANAPGNFQGKGTIYTRAQIQAALDGGDGIADARRRGTRYDDDLHCGGRRKELRPLSRYRTRSTVVGGEVGLGWRPGAWYRAS